MTNREYYKEQIINICARGKRPIIRADRLTGCSSRDCEGCPNWYRSQSFFGTGFFCKAQEDFAKWLEEECEPEVDWSRVSVDTQILVKNDRSSDKWFKRHFAYYRDGEVCAWKNGRTSYTSQHETACAWQYAKLYKQEIENDRT